MKFYHESIYTILIRYTRLRFPFWEPLSALQEVGIFGMYHRPYSRTSFGARFWREKDCRNLRAWLAK